MSKPIVRVNGLSKRYRLGLKETTNDNFGDALMAALKYPITNFKRLRNLSRFDEQDDDSVLWALRDVSFEVEQGDVLGVIGKNGAGKSTLLKLLSRITLPTSGSIEIDGRIASLLEVGTGFHQELTGRENIYMNGTILGMKKKEIDKHFDEIVNFSGVERFIDTPVKRYSSGMLVRLAFSVAAHLEPEVLIIDEVLAVGDAEFQKKCLGKMQSVSQVGRTVLFVSHNMQAVQSLCNKGLFLENGRVKATGTTEEVINQYLSVYRTGGSKLSWDDLESAPGNANIRLAKAYVFCPDRVDDELLYVDDDLIFEFEYWNIMGDHVSNLSIVLNNAKGEVIFNVFTEQMSIQDGKYRARFYMPKNILNDGGYSIDAYFIKNGSETVCRIDESVSFELHEPPRDHVWFGKWVGAIRPKLRSEFERV